MKTIKVLDLFAGTQSVKKGLKLINNKKYKFEYVGVDIYTPENEKEENIILDLSQKNIIKKLEEKLNGWKPDIIWASPVCITFSRAAAVPNGTLYHEIKNNRCVIREDFTPITHKAYRNCVNDPVWIKEYQEKAKLGLDLLNNTLKIIKHFKVPFAIENPYNAVSKYEFMHHKLIRNKTAYCRYGMPYKKITGIYSNMQIDLLNCNHRRHDEVMSGWPSKTGIKGAPSNNQDRSIVPETLIKDIITQLLERGNNDK